VAGNLTATKKAVGDMAFENAVTETYDRLGRETQISDPDAGITAFEYNAFDEVVKQITSELASYSKFMTMTYDALGRPETRVEPYSSVNINENLTSSWYYDDVTAGNKGKGRLTRETSRLSSEGQDTFERTYTYSSSAGGLLTSVQTNIWTAAKGSRNYITNYTYDTARRLKTVVYPMSPSFVSAPEPFTVEYTYNVRGYVEQMHQRENGAKTNLLYQVMESDAPGRIAKQYLGDTSVNSRGYETGSGRLTFTNASINNGGSQVNVQNFVYAYDGIGNMKSRSDLLHNLSEKLTYDDLDRLKSAQVLGQAVKNYDYDVLGSITNKSDHGIPYNYSMVNAGRHAVTSVVTPAPGSQTLNYTYNQNGNQINASLPDGQTRQISSLTFDLPGEIKIANSAVNHKFRYGPGRARYVQEANDGSVITYTDYVGEMYVNKTQGTGTDEEHRHYLAANGQRIGVLIDTKVGTTATKQFKFFHLDHLGSITSITDKQGTTFNIEGLSYDAFGKRRDASSWNGEPVTPPTEVRGYTGHEHLDDVGIIHMNGRVYDPNLGRMLSPDPIVSAPLFGQDWNRYSYAWNSPLRWFDPTGLTDTVVVTGTKVGGVGWGSFASGSSSSFGGGAGTKRGDPHGGGGVMGDLREKGQKDQADEAEQDEGVEEVTVTSTTIEENTNTDGLEEVIVTGTKLVPEIPPGVDIDKNIFEAEVARFHMRSSEWFYDKVRNGGPWDYKQLDPKYEEFGNFNYGATGTAFGFSEEILLRMAGWAQVQAGTTRSSWGQSPTLIDAYFGTGGVAPFGDDPNDQSWIQKGIQYYRQQQRRGK